MTRTIQKYVYDTLTSKPMQGVSGEAFRNDTGASAATDISDSNGLIELTGLSETLTYKIIIKHGGHQTVLDERDSTPESSRVYIDWVAGTLTLGLSSDGEYIIIDGTNGIRMYSGGNLYTQLSNAGVLTLGLTSQDHVYIDSTGISMKDSTVVRGQWQTDGDIFIGSDISSPATTYMSIFAGAQTYNTESIAAGDMLIGDNTASKANILWDKSTGQLLFRGGQTTQAYIDTTGAITFGGGNGILDSNGVAVLQPIVGAHTSANAYHFTLSGSDVGGLYAYHFAAGPQEYNNIDVTALSIADTHSRIYVAAAAPAGKTASLTLRATEDATATSIVIGTGTTITHTGNTILSGTLAVNGASITTDDTTFNLLNDTAITINLGGAATEINLGAGASARLVANFTTSIALNTAAITSTQTTVALLNTTVTTLNLGGAATTLSMGAGAASTLNANFTTAINLNTAAIVSNQTTVALINTTATTINAFGAATAINLGAASAVVNGAGGITINGGIAANDDITIQGTSHATRTSSYVLLQPNGGYTAIGGSSSTAKLGITGSAGVSGADCAIDFTETSDQTASRNWRVGSGSGTNYGDLAFLASTAKNLAPSAEKITFSSAGNINIVGVFTIDGTQVVGNRVVDARCDDAVNTGDATSDGVIDALRDAMIAHGLIAAS